MLLLKGVGYTHPNGSGLLSGLDLHLLKHDKLAIVGNNGTGKSTLLRIIAGLLKPSTGTIRCDGKVYYMQQVTGDFGSATIAEVLRIDKKVNGLQAVLAGDVSEANLLATGDDWSIIERCEEAFARWQLRGIHLSTPMRQLSGGERTKVLLAGIRIHEAGLVLLDEPSNHLDTVARGILRDYVNDTRDTLLLVSHDRSLLNLVDHVAELSRDGLAMYGGNFDFYREQKKREEQTLQQQLQHQEKMLRQAKQKARESIERQQKLDARGKKKQEKSGLPTISMNTFRNNAEKSTARTKAVHEDKTAGLAGELQALREQLPASEQMKIGFDNSVQHKGKLLVTASRINVHYDGHPLWPEDLDIELRNGERVQVTGSNGSGKSTLARLLTGKMDPSSGSVSRNEFNYLYVDQDYSLLDPSLTVYAQAAAFNPGNLQDHEIRSRLNRFLFTAGTWDTPVASLSGGERMRLLLCSLSISQFAPDLLVLDEPTNNLDLINVEILTRAVNEYRGSLLLITHDSLFAEETGITRGIRL
ncbi:MAG: ABC-F family ATP-binding cassette domain-containing protein [Chitinophagaceae bacterium]|nr:MAG: ABC-F family ATP-binding cassette domain-containing protein [Chitinophagaceae bacterium]